MREHLPNRREHDVISFTWTWGDVTSEWLISVSRYSDGRVAEVFLGESPKRGSELESLLQDGCVLISQLLQRGMTLAELRKSLGREGIRPDAPAGSILGLIVDQMQPSEST